jgi:hypothetical protein
MLEVGGRGSGVEGRGSGVGIDRSGVGVDPAELTRLLSRPPAVNGTYARGRPGTASVHPPSEAAVAGPVVRPWHDLGPIVENRELAPSQG